MGGLFHYMLKESLSWVTNVHNILYITTEFYDEFYHNCAGF